MQHSGECSCWSSGCVRTAQLPGTTADGQNWQHSQHHLQSDVTVISVLFPVITSAASMICPINQKYFMFFVFFNWIHAHLFLELLLCSSSAAKSCQWDHFCHWHHSLFSESTEHKNSHLNRYSKDTQLKISCWQRHTRSAKIIFQSTEPDTELRVGECVGMFYDSCKKTWN